MIASARYTETGLVEAIIDGARVVIPQDPENRHWQILQQWIADGGEIDPYEPPAPVPEPDPVEKLRAFFEANPDVKELILSGDGAEALNQL